MLDQLREEAVVTINSVGRLLGLGLPAGSGSSGCRGRIGALLVLGAEGDNIH